MIAATWKSLQIKDVVKKLSTVDKKIQQKQMLSEGKFPVIDQGQNYIAGYFDDQTKVIDEGEAVVFGDHSKTIKYVDFPFIPGADGTKVLVPNSELFNTKLFYYFLHCIKFPNKGYARHFQHLEKEHINIPPIDQQEKIVAKIEELFSVLDKTIMTLQNELSRCSLLRTSIIEHMYRTASTDVIKLSDVTEVITDGDHQAPPKSETGIPFIVISNIIKNRVKLDRASRYVPESYYESLKDSRKARTGDVLYTVTGSYGIPALIENDDKFCFQRHVALLRPNITKVTSKYLLYALQTDSVHKQATNIATGTAQLTVPLTGLRKITIPVVALKEQSEIVSKIESRLSELDALTSTVTNSIQLARNTKKSILSKAYKGELI